MNMRITGKFTFSQFSLALYFCSHSSFKIFTITVHCMSFRLAQIYFSSLSNCPAFSIVKEDLYFVVLRYWECFKIIFRYFNVLSNIADTYSFIYKRFHRNLIFYSCFIWTSPFYTFHRALFLLMTTLTAIDSLF